MSDTDPIAALAGTQRQVGGRPVRTLLLRRRYSAPVEDVWDACTNPDRLSRFFMRPAGDLRAGGSFSFEGNASGEILRCEPPRLLRVTWVYGERPGSQVELRLAPGDGGDTVLELEHSPVAESVELAGRQVDPVLNDPETGIWGLGTGWELGVIALDTYLRGDLPEGEAHVAELEPEILELAGAVGRAWAEAVRAEAAGRSPG